MPDIEEARRALMERDGALEREAYVGIRWRDNPETISADMEVISVSMRDPGDG
jgi:hypothetical protein